MSPSKTRPPDFDPMLRAWRHTGLAYLALGAVVFLFGCGLIAYSLQDPGVGDFKDITKIGGGLITVTSLQLFNMARKRFERIGVVNTISRRWADLAAAGGSESQIAELNRMIFKLFKENLSGAF